MITVGDIIQVLETVAPLALQESYDNAGLLTGSRDMEAHAALVCIDITEEVIDDAISQGANLVISHHPLVFRPLKSFTGKDYIERTLIKAIKNDIAIYACHTNMDNAWNGVNFKMAEMLGLFNLSILSPLPQQLLKLRGVRRQRMVFQPGRSSPAGQLHWNTSPEASAIRNPQLSSCRLPLEL